MTQYVVYTVDEDYWMPLYVSMYSLLDNNPDQSFRIFVLYAERDRTFFECVEHLDTIHDDVRVEGLEVDSTAFCSAPTPHWFTEATLFRLWMGSLLPVDADTVLYLDCDTIVDGSIAGLIATDLDGSVAAATPEYKLRSFELGFPVDDLFYNAGVMLVDLAAWEEHDVEDRALAQYETGPDVDFPVQEVLNPILNEDDGWTPLPPKYNAMTNWVEVLETETDERPVIVHYTGRAKPWHYSTIRLHKGLWWDYLERTPYRDYRPPDRTVGNQLIKTRRLLASRVVETVADRLESYPRLYEAAATVYRLFAG